MVDTDTYTVQDSKYTSPKINLIFTHILRWAVLYLTSVSDKCTVTLKPLYYECDA